MNMPHELCFDPDGRLYVVERDSHAVRMIDPAGGTIATVAGTGEPGFSGDGGPATQAQLRIPHSIAFDTNGDLLICDIGNHRVRRLNLQTGIVDTYAGTGEREPTPDGAPLAGTPLNGPRTIVVGPDGSLYLALREGNAIYRIDPVAQQIEHLAGTGETGYAGDGGPAREATLAGPKGLAYGPEGRLYVADTENHVIRAIDLASGVITTVLGTGERGDGPETSPLACRLARPHGLLTDRRGALYVADSEAHRIRVVQ
jgi:sugar lactone lactonase YvrE